MTFPAIVFFYYGWETNQNPCDSPNIARVCPGFVCQGGDRVLGASGTGGEGQRRAERPLPRAHLCDERPLVQRTAPRPSSGERPPSHPGLLRGEKYTLRLPDSGRVSFLLSSEIIISRAAQVP